MAIPELDMSECNSSENKMKVHNIIRRLRHMFYDVDDERDALHAIETCHLDKSQFDYHYGSFEEFKSMFLLVILMLMKMIM